MRVKDASIVTLVPRRKSFSCGVDVFEFADFTVRNPSLRSVIGLCSQPTQISESSKKPSI